MKKIISVLLLALTLTLFSSCIIIDISKHTMYFYNDTTNQNVYDWYVKDSDGENHLPSTGWNEVPPGTYDKIENLPEGLYTVWFCVYTGGAGEVYAHTQNYVNLDTDTTFHLSDERCYKGSPRSAVSSEEDNNDEELALIDSNGNKYELVFAQK